MTSRNSSLVSSVLEKSHILVLNSHRHSSFIRDLKMPHILKDPLFFILGVLCWFKSFFKPFQILFLISFPYPHPHHVTILPSSIGIQSVILLLYLLFSHFLSWPYYFNLWGVLRQLLFSFSLIIPNPSVLSGKIFSK